jgi:hypothetical protein
VREVSSVRFKRSGGSSLERLLLARSSTLSVQHRNSPPGISLVKLLVESKWCWRLEDDSALRGRTGRPGEALVHEVEDLRFRNSARVPSYDGMAPSIIPQVELLEVGEPLVLRRYGASELVPDESEQLEAGQHRCPMASARTESSLAGSGP